MVRRIKPDSDNHVIHSIGARSADGGDVYIATTKLFGKAHVIIDATMRLTKGNQRGIIGFGGNCNDSYHPQFEGSIAYLPSFVPGLVVGVEYRTKPRNQNFMPEGNCFDACATYFVNKHLNVTLAHVPLGTTAPYH
nr:DUF3034 family protein [Gluconacetobacter aggeris]